MNNPIRAILAAGPVIMLIAFFSAIANGAGPSQVTKSHICKAGIATVMGRDPSIMRIDNDLDGVLYLSYVRDDDSSFWGYKCKVEGSLIIWASDTGRWRDHPADSRLSYRIEAETIHVEEGHSNGSTTKKSFTLDQLGD
ncbi:MAG: hypothetical protein ACK4L8_01550 [Nitrincola lacisaponensis]|uniref:hypothetical protein n=1 Tax=Nitrincola lacisaponensis TaxID=267850 RepID=UPI00391C5254